MKLTILSILPLSCMLLPCAGGEKVADDGLRKAIEQAVYRVEPSVHGTYRGANPAQRLAVAFDRRTARLQHAQGNTALRLIGYGYGEHLRTPVQAKPTASGGRVEYRRGALTEWYVNEARGLEQGFTLTHRPGKAREGEPLVIAMTVEGGLRPALAATGDAVLLESGGSTILRYGGLRSWDARGRALAARLEVRDRQVRLVVEDREAEYPLVVDPLWTQEAKLTASDGGANDLFGSSVTVSGDTAVVGAQNKQVGSNTDQGAVYVFVRSGTTWTLQQELTASDGVGGDGFGTAVSLSGDTAVVGSNKNSFQGAAYVFVRSGTTWTQQQELTASDGAANDFFGASVAVSGDTAVVGAFDKTAYRGAAYVFVRSGTTWTQQQELAASDGTYGDHFGVSVAASGNTVVVGAYYKQFGSNNYEGAAYVFVRSGTTWTQQQELTASDAAASDQFGTSVAVSGDTAVVGAVGKNSIQGAAYVFVRSGTSWAQQQELTASDGTSGDYFGVSVGVSGDTAVVGAQGKRAATGAAYVFVRSGTTWTQQQELTASDGNFHDYFGGSVAVSGDAAVVGAIDNQVGSNGPGAAYVFRRGAATTTPSLSVGKSHTGTFTQGQIGGEWDITISNAAGSSATTGTTTVSDTLPGSYTVHDFATTAGSWMCMGAGTQTATCTSTLAVNGGSSFPPVKIVVSVPANSPTSVMNTGKAFGGGDTVHNSLATAATGSDSVSVVQIAASISATGGSGQSAMVGTAFTNALQATVLDANSMGVPNVTVTFAAPPPTGASAIFTGGATALTNASGVATKPVSANGHAGGPYTVTATAGAIGPANFMLTNTAALATHLLFVPMTPCRVIDTRTSQGFPAPFGGPSLVGGGYTTSGGPTRTFPIPSSTNCTIPANAAAYSFNVTVIPQGSLGFLTMWPTGQTRPLAVTIDDQQAQILNNAAIVPAGTSGSIDVFASNNTDIAVDINGYFISSAPGALVFVPMTPCRVLDTRNPTGPLGGPSLVGGGFTTSGGPTRTFPIPTSTNCSIPSNAAAYSFNVTVIPQGSLGFLTMWPTGQTRPLAVTIDDQQAQILNNAAIVPAGTSGSIDVFASNNTDIAVDINGYFISSAVSSLVFVAITPCRVVDTRGPTGPFGAPSIVGGGFTTSGRPTRTFPIRSTNTCPIPSNAAAYSFNVTAIPPGSLGFLTMWPTGQTRPLAVTLDDLSGVIVNIAALVPGGTSGSVDVFASQNTDLVIDINGYFVPSP